jgi:hypothetical protein
MEEAHVVSVLGSVGGKMKVKGGMKAAVFALGV